MQLRCFQCSTKLLIFSGTEDFYAILWVSFAGDHVFVDNLGSCLDTWRTVPRYVLC